MPLDSNLPTAPSDPEVPPPPSTVDALLQQMSLLPGLPMQDDDDHEEIAR